MIPGGTIRPKDFSIVKRDGQYHVFYIVHDTSLPFAQTENTFGHAVSYDLYNWTILPPVFATDTLGWDNAHVWAPSIVYRDSLYWMFYAGVSQIPDQYSGTQRIGLAVSSDLVNWTRVGAGPVYAGTQVPWAWSDSTNTAPAFRDPFVMPDPAHPGGWLMYYTASYGADTASTVVGVASSDGDFTKWTDLGPLLITWVDYSYSQVTESPHLFQHDGLWYLMLTSNSGQPLSWYTSADPTGPLGAWTFQGRLATLLGYDTTAWYASETYYDGNLDLFAVVQGDRIEFRQIVWDPVIGFALYQPPLLRVVSMAWDRDSVSAPDQVHVQLNLVNPYAGRVAFQLFTVDSLGGQTPVPADSAVWAPTSWGFYTGTGSLAWSPRRYPSVPDSDSVTVTRYRLATADGTAGTGILTVLPPHGLVPLPVKPPLAPAPDTENIVTLIPPWLKTTYHDGLAQFELHLDRLSPARLDLFDVAGRHVRTLADRELPAGVTVLPWDGRDAAGRALPRGIYFARLRVGDRTFNRRVLLHLP